MERQPRDHGQLAKALAAVLGSLFAACASSRPATARVDLDPARRAVEAARSAGAPDKAEAIFTKASGHLSEAESLASPEGGNVAERSRQAEGLARLAMAEAQCAESMARLSTSCAKADGGSVTSSEADKLRDKLRQSEEEQRRLEERVALLQRDLDVTETEVIRTKAKLKGIETKAEASSAIAEARILLRRVTEEKGRSANLARCQELLDRSEQQLREENYGAAAFFASKAQELLDATRRGGAAREPDRPAPKRTYVARSSGANVRRGPALGEPVLGKIPAGASVEATAIHGDWIKVKYGDLEGWAYRPLFD